MLRYLWAAPNTLIGLVGGGAARACGSVTWQKVDGAIEICGCGVADVLRVLSLPGVDIAALTLGHVVLARDAKQMEHCRRHERVHVRQYERWGPLFVPAYAFASLAAVLRGGHFYRDNAFERAAFRGRE